jgi:PBP1b-binding outer membrane lipoprotein LpoB
MSREPGKRKTTKAAMLICVAAFLFSGCSMFETRPVKQLAYAEAAMQAALLANADTNPDTMQIYQLARDSLARARSFYRLKNFREARKLAVRSRRMAEEAEWKALRGSSSKEGDSLVK